MTPTTLATFRSDYSETFDIELGTATGGGDAARLWVDGMVVIDGFERGETASDWEGVEEGLGGGGRGYVNLTVGVLHEVSIEFRCVHVEEEGQGEHGRHAPDETDRTQSSEYVDSFDNA